MIPCPQNPDTATFPETVHALLLRKGIHRPGIDGQDQPLCATLLHPAVIRHIAESFSTTHEWLTDPLTRCPHIKNYASTDPDDAAFGAIHGPYNNKWTGTGLFAPIPTTTDTYQALKWALMSAQEEQPLLNIGIVPVFGTLDGVSKLLEQSNVHTLCIIDKKIAGDPTIRRVAQRAHQHPDLHTQHAHHYDLQHSGPKNILQ